MAGIAVVDIGEIDAGETDEKYLHLTIQKEPTFFALPEPDGTAYV